MSDYHVLECSSNGSSIKVVMHIATPTGTNIATKTFSLCLVEDPSKDKTSIVPSITTTEQTDLTNGSLYEYVMSFRTHKDVPDITKRSRLDTAYNDAVNTIQAALRELYWGWGFERDVT